VYDTTVKCRHDYYENDNGYIETHHDGQLVLVQHKVEVGVLAGALFAGRSRLGSVGSLGSISPAIVTSDIVSTVLGVVISDGRHVGVGY